MTKPAEAGDSPGLARWARDDALDALLPFCGDEYPPLKGSPGAVICTKPCHPATEAHMNEETGWVWRSQWPPSRITCG